MGVSGEVIGDEKQVERMCIRKTNVDCDVTSIIGRGIAVTVYHLELNQIKEF